MCHKCFYSGVSRPPLCSDERLPDDFDMPEFSSVTNQWDLLYDYNTLMENVSDLSYRFCSSPSERNVRYKEPKNSMVTGRRDWANSLPFKLDSNGP
ncbi:pheophorbide a oxygenase [Cucumis melo var. makuwa]|uniref:Pheophorbide a oxygenase n=1 Tax=Cucumis melo var. makuwa TaxID=1194695 RepID=A0A5A7STB4_CUCMM|nr:pheophorbide a oxygenase [Cucumis melo var. makuwa]TYK20888.1 pheophorbide a oxygenase [Cucumis melo var. makuwa]